MTNQIVIPYLWYDTQATEAAEFYVATFGANSHIKHIMTLDETPSGSVDMVTFDILGYEFRAISAGPLFKFTPAISFHVKCATTAEVDTIWQALSDGATILMELGNYPFSPYYGWLQDKYGVSWQIILTDNLVDQPRIVPAFLFVGDVCGQTESAINHYTNLFPNSQINTLQRYGAQAAPDQEGTVQYSNFTLAGQEFIALDSAHAHAFSFNEAISLMVICPTQADIDHYWDNLSAVPEAEQCGWLKDRYGISWQIVPATMDELMNHSDPDVMARVTAAFLQMKKFDIATLQAVANQ
ncbi:MAG TPA: VOC family protein [Anaerolineae bacterium]|nr:VOC family protein [Anaerolineae bacterium]